jgi:hypothetical protein
MRRSKNQRGPERLIDSITYRISTTQRSYIEKIAESHNVGLCEAARIVMDAGIGALSGAGIE